MDLGRCSVGPVLGDVREALEMSFGAADEITLEGET